MSFNAERAFELLKKIGFIRVAGTPQELTAANILMDEIRSMGLKPELESFTVADAANNRATLEILEPYQATYTVTAFKCCENTPEEGLTADFVYVQDATEVSMLDVRGKIVMFNGLLGLGLFRRLLDYGVAGVITMSGSMLDTEENSDLVTRKFRSVFSAFGNLPAATIRIADAFDMVARGASRVRLTTYGENVDITSHNVTILLPGTDRADEVVSFGAHYDSVPFASGVFDNGAGSVVLMELLRWYNEHPSRRTLRFCWYGAEELGLEGSKAFVRDHDEEVARTRLMVNLDVGGPVLGQEHARICADKSVVNYIDAFMKIRGHAVVVGQGYQGSDGMPFADKGVPAFNFFRDAAGGSGFMHSRHDVIDYLCPAALAKTGVPVLDLVSELTESVVFPFTRTLPPEMITNVDNYFMKKEMAEAAKK